MAEKLTKKDLSDQLDEIEKVIEGSTDKSDLIRAIVLLYQHTINTDNTSLDHEERSKIRQRHHKLRIALDKVRQQICPGSLIE